MYDPQDSLVLEQRFFEQIQFRESTTNTSSSNLFGYHTGSKQITDSQIQKFMAQNQSSTKKLSRDEIMAMMRQKNQGKLLYIDFQKLILDFQLQEHEKFLLNFTLMFKEVDEMKQGIINEQQFKVLISKMGIIHQQEEVEFLLAQIDPYNNNKMTFSEVVQLLSSHMVASEDPQMGPNQSIPILEKFSLLMDGQQRVIQSDEQHNNQAEIE